MIYTVSHGRIKLASECVSRSDDDQSWASTVERADGSPGVGAEQCHARIGDTKGKCHRGKGEKEKKISKVSFQRSWENRIEADEEPRRREKDDLARMLRILSIRKAQQCGRRHHG